MTRKLAKNCLQGALIVSLVFAPISGAGRVVGPSKSARSVSDVARSHTSLADPKVMKDLLLFVQENLRNANVVIKNSKLTKVIDEVNVAIKKLAIAEITYSNGKIRDEFVLPFYVVAKRGLELLKSKEFAKYQVPHLLDSSSKFGLLARQFIDPQSLVVQAQQKLQSLIMLALVLDEAGMKAWNEKLENKELYELRVQKQKDPKSGKVTGERSYLVFVRQALTQFLWPKNREFSANPRSQSKNAMGLGSDWVGAALEKVKSDLTGDNKRDPYHPYSRTAPDELKSGSFPRRTWFRFVHNLATLHDEIGKWPAEKLRRFLIYPRPLEVAVADYVERFVSFASDQRLRREDLNSTDLALLSEGVPLLRELEPKELEFFNAHNEILDALIAQTNVEPDRYLYKSSGERARPNATGAPIILNPQIPNENTSWANASFREKMHSLNVKLGHKGTEWDAMLEMEPVYDKAGAQAFTALTFVPVAGNALKLGAIGINAVRAARAALASAALKAGGEQATRAMLYRVIVSDLKIAVSDSLKKMSMEALKKKAEEVLAARLQANITAAALSVTTQTLSVVGRSMIGAREIFLKSMLGYMAYRSYQIVKNNELAGGPVSIEKAAVYLEFVSALLAISGQLPMVFSALGSKANVFMNKLPTVKAYNAEQAAIAAAREAGVDATQVLKQPAILMMAESLRNSRAYRMAFSVVERAQKIGVSANFLISFGFGGVNLANILNAKRIAALTGQTETEVRMTNALNAFAMIADLILDSRFNRIASSAMRNKDVALAVAGSKVSAEELFRRGLNLKTERANLAAYARLTDSPETQRSRIQAYERIKEAYRADYGDSNGNPKARKYLEAQLKVIDEQISQIQDRIERAEASKPPTETFTEAHIATRADEAEARAWNIQAKITGLSSEERHALAAQLKNAQAALDAEAGPRMSPLQPFEETALSFLEGDSPNHPSVMKLRRLIMGRDSAGEVIGPHAPVCLRSMSQKGRLFMAEAYAVAAKASYDVVEMRLAVYKTFQNLRKTGPGDVMRLMRNLCNCRAFSFNFCLPFYKMPRLAPAH